MKHLQHKSFDHHGRLTKVSAALRSCLIAVGCVIAGRSEGPHLRDNVLYLATLGRAGLGFEVMISASIIV